MSQFPANILLSSLNGANGFQLSGLAKGDYAGVSLASGDVNGDGIADLIVGAPRTTGPNGLYSGSTYVVYGKPGGFGANFDLSSLDGTNGFKIVGALASDGIGAAVSAGDFNGDGVADVFIGAPSARPNGAFSGEVYVVFGKTSGFGATFDLGAINGVNGLRLDGGPTIDSTLYAVASAGDVNHDGYDDLIVGAPNAQSAAGRTGASYVVYGGASGFAPNMSLTSLNGTNGFKINGLSNTEYSGLPVGSAGDINGDGIDDFVIGAPGADVGGAFNTGRAYVVFGNASGFPANFDLATLNGTNGFSVSGITRFHIAETVSAGDINGDGFDDLILGSRSGGGPNTNYRGETQVIFGRAGGFPANIDISSLNGTNGFRITGAQGRDYAGTVSSAGDVNGDGFDDILVGASNAFANGGIGTGAGASYVIFGQASGFAPVISLSSLNGTNGFKISGEAMGDRAGGAVSAGDINGDGLSDLLVGAYKSSPNGSHSGAAYVVLAQLPNTAVSRTGTATSQTLVGGDLNDVLSGMAGNDTLYGHGGADTINGGVGDDTAVYFGALANYSITTNAQGFTTVKDLRAGSPDGTDTIVNIEHLRFSDQTIALNAPPASLVGGPGPDAFVDLLGDGIVSIDGAGGVNSLTVDWSSTADSIKTSAVSGGSGSGQDQVTGATLTFSNIQALSVTTGSGDDQFIGGPLGSVFNGGGGDDTFQSVGADTVDGGSGANVWTGDYTGSAGPIVLTQTVPWSFGLSNGATLKNIGSVFLYTGAGDDTFNLNSIAANLNINGNGGTNTLNDNLSAATDKLAFYALSGNFAYVIDPAANTTHAVYDIQNFNIQTSSGDDTFYVLGSARWLKLDGGGGLNSFTGDFSDSVSAIHFTLNATPGSTSTFVGQGDTLTNIQQVTITTGSGDDVLAGGGQNDVFNGGAGNDTAVFTGPGYYHSITTDASGVTTVQDLRAGSPDGTDTLTGIEHIQFSDGVFDVHGPNSAPLATNDTVSTPYAKPIVIPAASLLANDVDLDNGTLSLVAADRAVHGTVTLSGGQIVFTPSVGYVGVAGFSYVVADGQGGGAIGNVTVNVTGSAPAYIYGAGATAPQTIDFTGDSAHHSIAVGSADTTVLVGAGGASVKLGAGHDVVIGSTAKDVVTFGPGVGVVTGGGGLDAFVFVKGQIADPATNGGQYDTITDFADAGNGYSGNPDRDYLWFKGFSPSSTVVYEHDLASNPYAHVYKITDGSYQAEFVLEYQTPGYDLFSQFGFL